MSQLMYCVNHPKVETYLRCNKCGQPMCSRCARRTPIGYRCQNCVRGQQKVFYADLRPAHYLAVVAVALPLSLLAGWIVPGLGWLYALALGPIVGGGIAEAARWAIRRRRSPYTWVVVCACIAVGVLLPRLLSLFLITGPTGFIGLTVATSEGPRFIIAWLIDRLWDVVYLATAGGTAYARLRPERRV